MEAVQGIYLYLLREGAFHLQIWICCVQALLACEFWSGSDNVPATVIGCAKYKLMPMFSLLLLLDCSACDGPDIESRGVEMIDYSHPLFIRLRSFGRSLGVLRPAVKLYRRWFGLGYEQNFDNYMMSRIRPNDTVWDIGANVGHFTERFMKTVGPGGKVVAFEPSPTAQASLVRRFENSSSANVVIEAIALGDNNGVVTFWHSPDVEQSVTDGIGFKEGAVSTDVEMMTGDRYLDAHSALAPNCMKIDVEGFESDVLSGMDRTLKTPQLRAIFVEMHFEHSARRGLVNAPNVVVNILKQNGFGIKWVDPSHIAAER